MHKNSTFIYLILLIPFFSSCFKDLPACDENNKLVINTNSPLAGGDTLKMSVSGINGIYKCIWRGPNGYTSSSTNPVLPFASTLAAGVYTVDVVTETGCIYSAATDPVVVGDVTNTPCDINENMLVIGNAYYPLGQASPEVRSNQFRMYAMAGDFAWIQLIFGAKDGKIIPGIYGVGSFDADYVPIGMVRVSIGAKGTQWSIPEGSKIYVSSSGYVVTASFCNVTAHGSDGTTAVVNLHTQTY